MPAHPETVQGHVTTLDLLRELELRAQQEQSQQYLGTPRRQMLSGLPQYPSQGLENELFQKMSLRQALREVRQPSTSWQPHQPVSWWPQQNANPGNALCTAPEKIELPVLENWQCLSWQAPDTWRGFACKH